MFRTSCSHSKHRKRHVKWNIRHVLSSNPDAADLDRWLKAHFSDVVYFINIYLFISIAESKVAGLTWTPTWVRTWRRCKEGNGICGT